MPVDCIVAISDDGIVERVGNPKLPEVCKSDQVTDRVNELVNHYRRANSLLTTLVGGDDKGAWHTLRPQEMQRISDFLVQRHTPLSVPEPEIFSSPEQAAVPEREICAQCGKVVTLAVARYCRDQERRFGGKIYCMEHQRTGGRTKESGDS